MNTARSISYEEIYWQARAMEDYVDRQAYINATEEQTQC